jgi:hypothetical protein
MKPQTPTKGIVKFLVVLVYCFVSLAVFSFSTYAIDVVSSSPSGTVTSSLVNLTATTDVNSTCRYSNSDVVYENMLAMCGGLTSHTTCSALELSNGGYTYYVRCKDTNNNTMNTSAQISFNVNSPAPQVISHSPNEVSTNSYSLEIITNKNGFCKFSTSPGTNFNDMTGVFDITGETTHKETFNNVQQGDYEYYVRCRDEYGNVAQSDYEIEITADVPPSAQILLSDSSPVKPGTIDLTLVTSEDVQDAPSLSYTLQGASGSSTTISVPLSGSGRTWNGIMLIADTADKLVGSFNYRASDLNGKEGTLITVGKTFVVDSSSPPKVNFLKATAESDGDIKLRWYLDDEELHDVSKYRIYRAEAEGVNNLDFYDVTSDDSYIDTDTEINTKYYYKVSAFDSAGNEGPLSAEVSAVAENIYYVATYNTSSSSSSSSNTGYKLTNNLIQQVDERKQEVNDFLLEVKELQLELEADTEDEKDLKETFRFNQLYVDAINSINSYLKELEDIKFKELTNNEFDFELKKVNLKIDSLKANIPTSINVDASDQFSISTTEEDMQSAIQNIFNLYRVAGISEEDRTKYSQYNSEKNSAFTISPRYKHVTVEQQDGSNKKYTLVEKTIESNIDRSLLYLIETIPKSFAQDIKDITFVKGKYDVVKRDPVVRYTLSGLDEISYYVKGHKETTELIESKSVVVTDPEKFLYGSSAVDDGTTNDGIVTKDDIDDGTKNMITGRLIPFITNNPVISKSGIVVGIIVIAGLLVYYFFFLGNEPPGNMPIPKELKNNPNVNLDKKNIFNTLSNYVSNLTKPKINLPATTGQNLQYHHNTNIHNQNMNYHKSTNHNQHNLHHSDANNYHHANKPHQNNQLQLQNHEDNSFMYQNFASSEYEKVGLKPLKEIDAHILLKKANQQINNLEFDSANNIYFMLLSQYENFMSNLGGNEKETLAGDINKLYQKLCLYIKINQAHNCIQKNDYLNLSYLLNQVADHYNTVAQDETDNTRLLDYAKKWHNSYSAKLINFRNN